MRNIRLSVLLASSRLKGLSRRKREGYFQASANGIQIGDATIKGKNLSAEAKRLGKKRKTLNNRRNSAAAKAKKDPVVANRNALRKVARELADVRKAVAKNKPVKAANFGELSGLRISCRRLAAYGRALAAADKALNKPKKKSRKRKAK